MISRIQSWHHGPTTITVVLSSTILCIGPTRSLSSCNIALHKYEFQIRLFNWWLDGVVVSIPGRKLGDPGSIPGRALNLLNSYLNSYALLLSWQVFPPIDFPSNYPDTFYWIPLVILFRNIWKLQLAPLNPIQLCTHQLSCVGPTWSLSSCNIALHISMSSRLVHLTEGPMV